MKRADKLIFLTVAVVILVSIYYIQWRGELQQQEYQSLLDELQAISKRYNETSTALEEAHEHNVELEELLNKSLEIIDSIEQRNEELEQILFNQTQTYQAAVNMEGASMPVLTRSGFTGNMYERAFERLRAHGMKGTGIYLVQAEINYGINSLVLAAIAYLESAGGNSDLARNCHNLFGLLSGSGPMIFDSKKECINYAARLLHTSYLSRGSRFYQGDNLEAIGIWYAAEPEWADKVAASMSIIARAAIPEGR
jgi:hypothetical protein